MYAQYADALPPKKRSTPRRLVATDIENINGGAVSDPALAHAALCEIAECIGLVEGEQVVIGVGPSSLVAAAMSRPNARFVMRRGLDGADLALIDVLEEENIAERFDEVFIVSGDGVFAKVAAQLASAGVNVTVVARANHLSKRLRLAAGKVVLLADHARNLGKAA